MQNMNQHAAPEETQPSIVPLRKRRRDDGSLYQRPPEVEEGLAALLGMPSRELVERSGITNPEHPDYVRSECILYIVRRLDFGDEAFRDLFVILRQRVLRAVRVPLQRVAGAKELAEKSGDLEVRETVLQKFQELFCNDRRDYDDRLDFFECRFNSAVACLRKRAQEKVELHDSAYETTDFGDNSAGASKEAELALLAMRDALDDRGMDFLYRSKLHAAIKALPPDLRRVVELTFQEVPDGPKGGDAVTICNLVGCTEKTVYNRRKKAFEALRDMLKREEDE